ncbi:MAG: exodeoxyribonuclease III [Candidatus Dactylopiibacterium sp.]|nr:exodeoxyribonuclease III [Candidatus Dactylopiibacterium sp.]
MVRIITANLNGIRSAASKGFFEWLATQQADVVCLQELKAQEADMSPQMLAPEGLQGFFHFADKRGYSGVGIYSRHAPVKVTRGIGVAEFDAEGRYVQVDLDLPSGPLSVVSIYLPSGSSGEERQAAKFRFMAEFAPRMALLHAAGNRVILCADWNIAPSQIDLRNWKTNQKNSGFLPEEREWMAARLAEGWTDAYRCLHPDATDACYTWWSNRGQAWAKNVGWRLDYQLVTPSLATTMRAASVYKAQRFSDHAPLIVDYAL